MKTLLSYIIPFTIEKRKGELPGELEVALENGRYVLNTKEVNYSFGGLHTIFKKAFAKLEIGKYSFRNILILGFGTGSAAELLVRNYNCTGKITGIERDGVVIDLARKYFHVDRFRDLELIHAEASVFLRETKERFDLIIVDVFVGTAVPPQLEKDPFLENLRRKITAGGMILFNRAYFDDRTRALAERVRIRMNELVGPTELLPLKAYGLKNCMLVTRM